MPELQRTAAGKVKNPLHRCERCPRYEPVAELTTCEQCYRMVCPQCVHRCEDGAVLPLCEVCVRQDYLAAVTHSNRG